MDWTMIENARDASSRVLAVLYLTRERYLMTGKQAGTRLRRDYGGSKYCEHVISEIKASIAPSAIPPSLGALCSVEESRCYLQDLVDAYQTPIAPVALDWIRIRIRRHRTRMWPEPGERRD
jgi:hypothetical protein